MKKRHASIMVMGLAATLIYPAAVPATAASNDATSTGIVRPFTHIELPASYPAHTVLATPPDNPRDAALARGLMPYDEIAPSLNALMEKSDRVSVQVVGQSGQGNDIHLVTVTAPETAQQTLQQSTWRNSMKDAPTQAKNDVNLIEGYKTPIWFNSNLHGNELEGTDASMQFIARLATANDAATEELLARHRLYFTVSTNPDGRISGERGVANGLDPNRDLITGATAETVVLRDLVNVLQPVQFVDIHGYTGTLQVDPAGPPHGENYEYDLLLPHAYAAALEVERAVKDADVEGVPLTEAGGITIPYRDIRSGWDDWPPVFAAGYTGLHGAVSATVELPLGLGEEPVNLSPVQRGEVNVKLADIVMTSMVKYVDEHRDALIVNQMNIFERGSQGAASTVIPADIAPDDLAPGVPTEWTQIWDENDMYNVTYPRAYVIPQGTGQRSDSDGTRLVEQLNAHGVEVQQVTEPLSVGTSTFDSGSFYVDMHQPLRGLANALLSDGRDLSSSPVEMFENAAWSLGLLWGATVAPISDSDHRGLAVAANPVDQPRPARNAPAQTSHLGLQLTGAAEAQFIAGMLEANVELSQTRSGDVFFPATDANRQTAQQLAEDLDVTLTPVTPPTEARDVSRLRAPRVAYTASVDDRVVLPKIGFAGAREVTAATLADGSTSLGDIDVLWVGGFLDFETSPEAKNVIKAYVDAGRPIVGYGDAAAALIREFGLGKFTTTTAGPVTHGTVRVENEEGGLLTGSSPYAFVSPATWFTELGADVRVERRYSSDPVVSGKWPDDEDPAASVAAGQPAAISMVSAAGNKVVLFGTSPAFRAHTVGSFGDMARAIYWANLEPTDTKAPAEPEVVPTPQPGPETATPVGPTGPDQAGGSAGLKPTGPEHLATTGAPVVWSTIGLAAALMALGAAKQIHSRRIARRGTAR